MLKNGVSAHSSEYLAAPPEELGMTQDPRMCECCSTRPKPVRNRDVILKELTPVVLCGCVT